MAKPRYMGKELTRHLRDLAMEAETITDSGESLTKAQALAAALWKKALGWTENRKMDDGSYKEIVHAPEAWAIQLIYDRLEGKVAQSVDDGGDKPKIADRVSELAKKRVNSLAQAVVGQSAPKPPAPPKLPPRKQDDGDSQPDLSV